MLEPSKISFRSVGVAAAVGGVATARHQPHRRFLRVIRLRSSYPSYREGWQRVAIRGHFAQKAAGTIQTVERLRGASPICLVFDRRTPERPPAKLTTIVVQKSASHLSTINLLHCSGSLFPMSSARAECAPLLPSSFLFFHTALPTTAPLITPSANLGYLLLHIARLSYFVPAFSLSPVAQLLPPLPPPTRRGRPVHTIVNYPRTL